MQHRHPLLLEHASGPQNATVIVTRADAHKGQRLARHLRADGFVVHEAHDARELIAWCRAFRTAEDKLPDVVITDAGLPDMSGLEAVKTLKRDGGVPPFILITASDDWRTFVAAETPGRRVRFRAARPTTTRCATPSFLSQVPGDFDPLSEATGVVLPKP